MASGSTAARSAVAVIGMACRVPGANSPEAFWRNLRDGVESIRRLGVEEMLAAGLDYADLQDPRHVPAGALADDVDLFDAGFFGYTAREAEIMDPQHRLFLECAWQALENAGCDPGRYEGAISVFGGGLFNSYVTNNLVPGGVFDDARGTLSAVLSNEKDYMTARVSYKLNLRGPSYNVQSGCSTSLVAIHLACQNLLNYESDIALAGGVAVDVSRRQGYFHHDGSVHSPDGHCRPFDAGARGTVFGNGTAMVVLKRLEDAEADGDTIHAIVLGSATNNDGSLKVGFTAPSLVGQSRVIAEALEDAGVPADSIGYVETHGTGTALGDPIEVEAMTQAYAATTKRRRFCAIGSVKSNIGHLDAAAGVTGFIKAVLALRHRQIPPSLHFERPNPKLELDDSPFFVASRLTEWRTGTAPGVPRRAGVSSFGMGGTNAHVVLEEAPEPPAPAAAERPAELLIWSARSEGSRDRFASNLAAHLESSPQVRLADVAHTLRAGRARFDRRSMLVCAHTGDAVAGLRSGTRVRSHQHDGQARRVAFMFPGQGAQYVGMGRELYRAEPVFRRHLEACLAAAPGALGADLRAVLVSDAGDDPAAAQRLTRTELAQPALFAVEYSLACLWQDWGVDPVATIGHSIGEYVAACLAGVFTPDDAMSLVIARGQLMQGLPAGAMTAVPLPAADLMLALPASLSIAAANAPTVTVVAGTIDDITRFEADWRGRGIECRRLHTSHAFHSSMVDSILPAFAERISRVPLNRPARPFVSNVTGRWITDAEATDPAYWAGHLRRTVRFADGLQCLLDREPVHLLEVGPGRTLSSLARQFAATHSILTLHSLPPATASTGDVATMLDAVGQLWLRGIELERAWASQGGRRIPLPTYSFDRSRYWVDPEPDGVQLQRRLANRKNGDVSKWCYLPGWREVPPPFVAHAPDAPPRRLLVFDGGDAATTHLSTLLIAGSGGAGDRVSPGARFSTIGNADFEIALDRPEDYVSVIRHLASQDRLPTDVVHCTTLSELTSPAAALDAGFFSLLYLVQALAIAAPAAHVAITVVTSGTCDVTGNEVIQPECAALHGLAVVIPQEHARLGCRVVDVERGMPAGPLAEAIACDIQSGEVAPAVAMRGRRRWVPAYSPIPLPEKAPDAPAPDADGACLVIGGLGHVGFTIAGGLALASKRHLALVGRTPLPPLDQWEWWVSEYGAAEPTSVRIWRICAFDRVGASVSYHVADVGSADDLAQVVREVEQAHGRIASVVFAAGIADASAFAPLMSATRASATAQFRPKTDGLEVLEQVLGDRRLDFCLVSSSLSSLLGGLGYGVYAAANRCLDAFTRRHNKRHGTPWLAVNWDAFVPFGGAAHGTALSRLAMTSEEARAVLVHVLRLREVGQIAISTADLEARLAQWVGDVAARASGVQDEPEATHARPAELESSYEAPGTVTERIVADVWQHVLGIDRVGVHDNFLDLGGNSLTAIQVIGQLQEQHGARIAIEEFIFLTVRQLAALCDSRQPAGAGAGRAPGDRAR